MENKIKCLNPNYSTTKLCYNLIDDKYLDKNSKIKKEYKFKLNFPEFGIINSKIPAKEDEKFDTYLFLPEGENRQGEGGLRIKGYFKKSLDNKPSISIITVVYNGEKYLEETIKSVITQTYNNVEYIIIDGGSTDGTLDIIKKYEKYIDYWVSEKDHGIYDAMNKGIKVAIGNGLLFLNAGDYFVGSVLNENIKIPCLLPVKYKDYFGKLKDFKIRDYRYALPNCHQGILFENKRILYDIQYKIAADYDFYIKHNYKNNLVLVDISGYIYYDRGYSLINYKEKEKEMQKIIMENFNIFYFIKFVIGQKIKRLIKKILGFIKK
jgi:glycosyltransferase involved in cell wall biosynthesis